MRDPLDDAPAPPVIVQRRSVAGHDRLYVHIDGADIGYRDLATDEVVCEQPLFEPAVTRATATLTPRYHVVDRANGPVYDYRPRHHVIEDARRVARGGR